MAGGELDVALPDGVNGLKFFCSVHVGDASADFVTTTHWQRPPADQASSLGVDGRAAEGGRSNSDGWQRDVVMVDATSEILLIQNYKKKGALRADLRS